LKKNNSLLLAANTAYSLADIAFDFFLSWQVYSITGNIMNLITILSGSILFRAILSLGAGTITDIRNKKKLLIFSSLASIPIVLCSMWLIRFQATVVWLYVALVLVNDVFNTLFAKSFTTISAEMMDETGYIRFKSVVSVLNQSINVLGQAAMGFILLYAQPIHIISSVVLFLLIAAICIMLMDYKSAMDVFSPSASNDPNGAQKKTGFSLKQLLFIAKNEIFNDSYYRSFCITIFTLNLVYGFISSVLPYSISANREASSAEVGMMKSVLSMGGIMGMLVVPKIAKRVTQSFLCGLVGSLASMVFVFLFKQDLTLVYVSFFFYGLFDSITQPLYSYTVKRIDDRVRGSVLGVIDFIILLASPLGMFICGTLANKKNIYMEFFIIFIFSFALLIVKKSKDLNAIYLE